MALGSAVAGSARVIVGADTRDLDKGMRTAEQTFTGSVGRIGKAALGLGGILGAAGLAGAAKAAWGEFREGEKVAAQTEAVLKSTGNIAGVTASQVDQLAQAWLRKTGIDDEQIKSAENVLLTFTNVRNVVGQNNDIFNQATEAALNMSTALGEDLQGAVIRIGKALQDPIVGVTALRRVGVALTEQQKDQIKTLVQSGDVLSAQKIILRELNTEFGGQAEAVGKSTGEWKILREELLNFGGQLAAEVAPAIHDVVTQLIEWLDQLEANKQLQDDVKNAVRDTVDVIRTMIEAADRVADALGGWSDTLKLILTLGVAAKIGAMATAFTTLAGTEAAAGVAGGTGIAGAAAGSSRLLTSLRALSKIGTIAILLDVSLAINKQGARSFATDLLDSIKQVLMDPRKGIPGWVPFDPAPSQRPSSAPSAGATAALTQGTPAFKQQQKAILGYASKYGVGSGITYTWGGVSPETGYDCSGFLMAAYAAAGVQIPHNTVVQFNDPEALDTTGREEPGDGVYFETNGPGGAPQHCGIYLGGGRFIEYYSRGKPAKYNTLGAKGGYMGARRWLKIVPSGGGGDTPKKPRGAKPPTSGSTPTTTKTSELIPARLQLNLAKARLTEDTKDDIKALQAIEDYLTARYSHEKNINEKIEILDELRQTRDEIKQLKKGREPEKPEEPPFNILPKWLELRLAKAEVTKKTSDDLAVLKAIVAYLAQRAAHEKDLNKQIELLQALRAYRDRLDQVRESRKPKKKQDGPVTGRAGADATGFGQEVDDLLDRDRDVPTGPAIDFVPKEPLNISATEQVVIDRILASFKPQIDFLKNWWQALFDKRKAAIERRDAEVRTIGKLDKTPKKLRDRNWRKARADAVARRDLYIDDIARLGEQMDTVRDQILDLDATQSSEIQEAANEDERAAADKPPATPSGTGGGFSGGDTGGDTPAPLSQAITPEQIAAMRAEVLAARSGFFREFGPNVFTGPPGSLSLGSAPLEQSGNVIVIQNFQTPPPDQHAYFMAAQFAAEHALG